MKFIKYGYGRATDQICIEIRSGRMTREEGIKALKESTEGTVPMKYIPDFLDYLNITEKEYKHDLIKTVDFSIIKDNHNNLKRSLKQVSQYTTKSIEIQKKSIKINDMNLMTCYVKSYKYNQIERLSEILNEFSFSVEDFCSIKFKDGTLFPITPIIIEKHGSEYFVVKGNSRLSYLYREKELESISTLLVVNVKEPLPSSGQYELSDVIITTQDKEAFSRYNKWVYKRFRHIEFSVREPGYYIEESYENTTSRKSA